MQPWLRSSAAALSLALFAAMTPAQRVVLFGGKPQILLSNATVASSASVGTTVGTLSVIRGTGSYTYSLTSNPGGLYSILGSALQVAASLSAGSDPITVKADNGAGSVISQPFSITVTGPTGCSNKFDFTQPCNSQYLAMGPMR